MEEQLKQLKNRIQLLEAKMEFQRENTVAMSGILKDMGHDVDAIITTFNEVQAQNETVSTSGKARWTKIKKVGYVASTLNLVGC